MTTKATDPVLDDLADDIAGHAPGAVLFWSGAGVSVPGPTSLPTGWELTDRAFRAFFEPEALATVLAYHTRACWFMRPMCDAKPSLPAARPPRLETVIGVAERVFGTRSHVVLDDIRRAEPNYDHRFFAAHVAAGGRHVTANFDCCIEDAHESLIGSPPDPDSVVHFHGELAAHTTAYDLGVTLERIQRGFVAGLRNRLVDEVSRASTTVFAGYSGSDFFDVDVAFANLTDGSLDGRDVVWISHGSCGAWHELDPPPSVRPPLARSLAAAGARVRYFCGATETLLDEMAKRWHLAVGAPVAAPRRVRETMPAISDSERRRGTFALYRELGLIAEVSRMLEEGDLAIPDSELLDARSEALWEQGRWTTLRQLWRRSTAAPPFRRAERIAATYWVQGRLIPAYISLARQRRRAVRLGSAMDVWMLDETTGRVIEHMARTPDLRLVAKLLARRAIRRLGATPDQNSGVHVFRRHTDLVSSLADVAGLRVRSTGIAAVSQEWFAEAGSMLAAVAYGHRALRDSSTPDAPLDDVRRRYRAHVRWAVAVGTVAGAWRTLLLPDAARVFTVGEAVAGVCVLEYGPWHRVRILARFAAKRLLAHVRRTAKAPR